jgi:hypothetical protein
MFDDSIDICFSSKVGKLLSGCQLRLSFDNGLAIRFGRAILQSISYELQLFGHFCTVCFGRHMITYGCSLKAIKINWRSKHDYLK